MHAGKQAKFAWAKVLAQYDHDEAQRMVSESHGISRTVLRLARIRLDIVHMALFRLYIAKELESSIIYLFTDGSPQWRGVEMMASTMDLITCDNQRWTCLRMLLSVVRIGNRQLDLIGKTCAILWKIMLIVGPSYTSLRSFLAKACKAMSVLFDICRRMRSSFDFVAKIRCTALLKKEHRNGRTVSCMMKGRLITYAWDHANTVFNDAVTEICSWSLHDFGEGASLQSSCIGAVQYCRSMGMRKLQLLDHIPHLLSRLGEPGIVGRVLAQYREVPKDQHHPVTLRFSGDDSPIKSSIVQLPEAGGGLPDGLRQAAQQLVDIPFDDHIADGATCKGFWVIIDLATIRVTATMHSTSLMTLAAETLEMRLCSAQWSPCKGNQFRGLTESQKLMAEFLGGALQQYDYFSAPSGPGDDVPFHVYQVIAKQTKDILVETTGAALTDTAIWLLRPMDIFVDPTSGADDDGRVDVFAVATVSVYSSIFAVFGGDATNRSRICRWQ
ncbi:unnamed protein product, partial [Prorocentrum cordatum]